MSLFRRKGPSWEEIAHENKIKRNITKELSASIRQLQKENLNKNEPITSNEDSNYVCSVLEAILLHGLKSSVTKKITKYIPTGSENHEYTTNFWNYVSKFTHSDVTAQLKRLGQIITEVGLCRAWIRVALNDCLMESYVDAMLADKKTTEYYYHKTAYLRDVEQPEIFKSYLKGLMSLEFKLSFNSRVLNAWMNEPLILAGIIQQDDTPLPVIAKNNQGSKNFDENTPPVEPNGDVEVRSVRSRSRGSSIDKDKHSHSKKSSRHSSSSSASAPQSAVFSSDLTRRDIDAIRELSRSKAVAHSECSSSSLVSCPDPSSFNKTPEIYREKPKIEEEVVFQLCEDEEKLDKEPDSVENEKKVDSRVKISVEIASKTKPVDEYVFDREEDQIKKGETQPLKSKNVRINNQKIALKSQQKNTVDSSVTELYSSAVGNSDEFKRELLESGVIHSILGEEECEHQSVGKTDRAEHYFNQSGLPSGSFKQSETDSLDGNMVTDSEPVNKKQENAVDQVVKSKERFYLPDKCDQDNFSSHDPHQSNFNRHTSASASSSPGMQQSSSKSSPYTVDQKVSKAKRVKSKARKERLKPSLSPSNKVSAGSEISPAIALGIEQTQSPLRHQKGRMSMPDLRAHLSSQTLRTLHSLESHSQEDLSGHAQMERDEDNAHSSPIGNSLGVRSGWSSSYDLEEMDTIEPLREQSDNGNSPNIPSSRSKADSFNSMLKNYTPCSSVVASPTLDDVLQELGESSSKSSSPRKRTFNRDEDKVDSPAEDFEIVSAYSYSSLVQVDDIDKETEVKINLLGEIANEKGLDAQNFQCGGCKRPVGLIYGKPRLCTFDGKYYCFECHENDEYYIPAHIVHNWDFKKYPVCKQNLTFLQEVAEDQPLIELNVINYKLYEHVKELEEIKLLRRQLVYLKTYLFTCKQSVAEELRKSVWPKHYLYEHHHTYSLSDLLQVPSGQLTSSLKKIIKFATKHVYECRLCSQKGFICELCNNPNTIIYPFQLDLTVRCSKCKSVFHKACKTEGKPCPKCQRREQRRSQLGSQADAVDNHDYTFSPD